MVLTFLGIPTNKRGRKPLDEEQRKMSQERNKQKQREYQRQRYYDVKNRLSPEEREVFMQELRKRSLAYYHTNKEAIKERKAQKKIVQA
jgi:hypothetical protein